MAFRTNTKTGNVFQVSDYERRLNEVLVGREYKDLKSWEKARVNLIMEGLQRERVSAVRRQAEGQKFERRSMLTRADIARNAEVMEARRRREQVEGLKPRSVRTKLRYNEAGGRWEMVQE